MTSKPPRWIQGAEPKHCALHRQLGYGCDEPLPHGLIEELHAANVGSHIRGHTVTTLLKRRVNFAVNAQKRRR